MAVVTATGILASLPAPLIFSVPLRDELAYVFSGFQIPTHTGWDWILARYPHALFFTLSGAFRKYGDTESGHPGVLGKDAVRERASGT